MVILNEIECERCQRNPTTSVEFRHWTIVLEERGKRRKLPPTPGLNRDGDMAIAEAVHRQGGYIGFQCPDYPSCALVAA